MPDDREQRNAIFAGAHAPSAMPAGVDPRMPSVNMAEQLRQDFGLELPVEVVPLPSEGRAYDRAHPLFGAETVEIKGMTAREEDILTSTALLKKGTVITELIRSCLMNPKIDPASLLAGDRNTLVVAIRVTGYGAEYEAEIECAACNEKTPAVFDLAALPLKRLKIDPVAEGQNLFEFRLPYAKKLVQFRFLTGQDEENIVAVAQRTKKLSLGGDTNVTSNLLHSIVSIEGITDRQKISGFVKSVMCAGDSLALRTFIRENEPGISMKQEIECKKCGASEEVDMPMGVKFLWPHAG